MRRRQSRQGASGEPELELVLNCMAPFVAFQALGQGAWSVVLTSGTLSPLTSFRSELGADFQNVLETPHVVDMKRQVWAGSLSRGPGGMELYATYHNVNDCRFQDAVGHVLVKLCHVVPNGMLVFFPSYATLDRLYERWEATGMLAEIQAAKTLVIEPRGSGSTFDSAAQRYFRDACTDTGAVMFAVCRGKVSEGLDFADEQARAVVVLGIPLPAFKDKTVQLKR